jgi:serine/threonine-protein kinase
MSEASAAQADPSTVDRTLDESGTVLGERYRLLRPLGEGGAGIVYAATDERIGAEVAVKVVRGSARRDEITLARFHREARAAGKLGHPNIVRVTDFGTNAGGSPYVVMERLDGETLEARIQRDGRLDAATAMDVHVQLADALAAAHAAGVLHRDVKPANVFLTQLATGKVLVKLLDFGLAELYQEPGSVRLTERGLLVGSLAYLAPERVLGAAADEQSDVYGIGASLYESLTGSLPFAAPNPMMTRAKILAGELPVLDGVPDALAAVVRSCLARDPAERTKTAADVRRALIRVELDASKSGATTATPSPSPSTTMASATTAAPVASSLGWWVAAAAILALVCVGYWAMTRAPQAPQTAALPLAAPATVVPHTAPPSVVTPSVAPAPPDPVPLAPASVVAEPAVAAPSTEPAPSPAPAAAPSTRPRRSESTGAREHAARGTTEGSRFDHIQEPDWSAPIAPVTP